MTSKDRAGAQLSISAANKQPEVNAHIWLGAKPRIHGCASDSSETIFMRAAGEESIEALADTLLDLGNSIKKQLCSMRSRRYKKHEAHNKV